MMKTNGFNYAGGGYVAMKKKQARETALRPIRLENEALTRRLAAAKQLPPVKRPDLPPNLPPGLKTLLENAANPAERRRP